MRVPLAAVLLAVVSLFLVSGAKAAGPSCHCFRDRDYDPANPGKSDEYLLATVSNTLLSAAYGVPKRDVVQARMSGTPGEDLWVAAFAAHRQGTEAAALLKARAATAAWREVFDGRGVDLASLGSRFTAALAAGAGDGALAMIAAAETLAARLGTSSQELDELSGRGATIQEMVLAALIAGWSSRSAPEIYAEAKTGNSGWSRILAAQGRVPKQMETEIPKALRPAGR